MRPLAWFFIANIASCAASVEDEIQGYVYQDWHYNATLWWSEIVLADERFGPFLARVSEELTLLTHMVFLNAAKFCLSTDTNCPYGLCEVGPLALMMTHIFAGFRNNIIAHASLLTPDIDNTPVGHVIFTLLQVTAEPGNIPGCDALVAHGTESSGTPCRNIGEHVPTCTKGCSTMSRQFMERLHDAQIIDLSKFASGVVETSQGQSRIVDDLRAAPRPVASSFHESRGSRRADILVSLLREVAQRKAPAGLGTDLKLFAVEVGVDRGATSEALLKQFPDLHLLLVDPFQFADEHFFSQSTTYSPSSGADVSDFTWNRLAPYRKRCIFATQRSIDAAEWIAKGSVDLVFIDGDHSLGGVREDIALWLPKLRVPGGVLAGHDYSFHHMGVVRAVHEFAGKKDAPPLKLGSDHVWWFEF
eukprot:TRINITY_DN37259_c0_g1_i1.p1 TRINITY_DN37259_c0_g1~~TRINITY_DN37259_c0_g1_i1.p1  ORF type:complete len:417 (+),score=48.23 TRINITY_DN37259_c0_g1_i1:155-1405(+)